MTGFYLKGKRQAGGDLESEEDIRKIHGEKGPSGEFRSNFVPSEGNVCSVERGQEEGRDAVFVCT